MNGRDDRRLVKLVRDDVERFCGGNMVVTYEPMGRKEHSLELRKKLVEEALEYVLEPSMDELADVLEALIALARRDLAASLADVMNAAIRKRKHKGGFDRGLGMYLHIAPGHRGTPQ